MVHAHSLLAYTYKVAPELSRRQKEVLGVFEDGQGHTDREVAEALGLEINQVTGRIAELIEKQKIFESGEVYTAGRPRRVCQIIKATLF